MIRIINFTYKNASAISNIHQALLPQANLMTGILYSIQTNFLFNRALNLIAKRTVHTNVKQFVSYQSSCLKTKPIPAFNSAGILQAICKQQTSTKEHEYTRCHCWFATFVLFCANRCGLLELQYWTWPVTI